MFLLKLSMILLAAVLSSGCRLADPEEDPLLVSDLRFSPSAFDSFRRNTEMRFSLRYPAVLSISVVRRDSSGEVRVRSLLDDVCFTKGSHSVTWLGDTDERLFAPTGVYLGMVRTRGERFIATVEVFHF